MTATSVTEFGAGDSIALLPEGRSLGDLLDDDRVQEYDWCIPDLLERGDRVVLTGGEGAGKSLWLRQFGLKAAAGIHPATDDEIPPVSVLHVDLENSEPQSQREYAKLMRALEHETDGDELRAGRARRMLNTVNVPAGVELAFDEAHQTWLLDLAAHYMIDLLVIGPLYKMTFEDDTSKEAARALSRFLDELRVEHGCAVMIEAHSPHENAEGERTGRPIGYSLWRRWPEFGFTLRIDGGTSHWRGARDRDRVLPDWTPAGKDAEGWPWQAQFASGDAKIVLRQQRAERVLREEGEPMSPRAIYTALGSKGSYEAFQRDFASWVEDPRCPIVKSKQRTPNKKGHRYEIRD